MSHIPRENDTLPHEVVMGQHHSFWVSCGTTGVDQSRNLGWTLPFSNVEDILISNILTLAHEIIKSHDSLVRGQVCGHFIASKSEGGHYFDLG